MLWVILGIAAVFCCYWKLVKPYRYWREKGVKVKCTLQNVIQKEPSAELIQRMYTSFPGSRYSGMYQLTAPTLLIKDTDLIREITVENCNHFNNQNGLTGEGLNALTSTQIKDMFVLMSNCAQKFIEHFMKANVSKIELQDSFSRFASDIVATCAFGVRCDSLSEKNNEFYLMGKQVTSRMALLMFAPKIAKFLGVTQLSKPVKKFFTNLVRYTVKFREATNIGRPDLIQFLMEARKARLVNETENEMTEQALSFLFACSNSVATLMCFIGYELALNSEIQERLTQEVDAALLESNGKITYEALNNMKYLDMVIAETLRKWPPTIAADIRCVIPYTIQPKHHEKHPVTLAKDDAILLPIYAIHRDSKFHPNPDTFDPERFSDKNKDNIDPYTYMPFGVESNNCIGSRFALLEAKIVYFHLLSKFEIVVVEKTQIPLKLSNKGFTTDAENGLWLGLKRRN